MKPGWIPWDAAFFHIIPLIFALPICVCSSDYPQYPLSGIPNILFYDTLLNDKSISLANCLYSCFYWHPRQANTAPSVISHYVHCPCLLMTEGGKSFNLCTCTLSYSWWHKSYHSRWQIYIMWMLLYISLSYAKSAPSSCDLFRLITGLMSLYYLLWSVLCNRKGGSLMNKSGGAARMSCGHLQFKAGFPYQVV